MATQPLIAFISSLGNISRKQNCVTGSSVSSHLPQLQRPSRPPAQRGYQRNNVVGKLQLVSIVYRCEFTFSFSLQDNALHHEAAAFFLSSSTVMLQMDPNSAAGLILPLLCSREACPLLDMAIGLRRQRTAKSTPLEGKGRMVRPR